MSYNIKSVVVYSPHDADDLWIGESPLPMVLFYNKELIERDGLTLEKAAVQYEGNDKVGFSYPSDGTSAVPDGISLIKGAPNEDNAKLFIDFATLKEFQESTSTISRKLITPTKAKSNNKILIST